MDKLYTTREKKLCECGCGKTTLAPYRRFLKNHRQKLQFKEPEYLIDKNGCWIWQKAKRYGLYGYKWDIKKGHHVRAHRYYYEKYKGKIPKGLVIDHLCSVRSCINPDHLEVVTQAENVHRSKSTRLSVKDVAVIRKLLDEGKLLQKEIGKKFGVIQQHISDIKLNKKWKTI